MNDGGAPHPVSARLLRRIPFVVPVVSACVLALQVTLTRILSFVSYYHHVFLVVSSAVLGLGVGGFLQYRRTWRRGEDASGFTADAVAAFAVCIPACLVGCLLVPAGVVGYIVVLTPPFVCAGMFLSAA